MISKDEFKESINIISNIETEESKWMNLGLNIFDTPLFDNIYKMYDLFWKTHFTTIGVDCITWWLYEKNDTFSGEVLEVYDSNNDIIPTDTIDDLWELIKEYRK